MHDSEQEHSSITGCRVTYESTIFYNEANKFSIIVVKTNDPRIPLQACSGRYYGDRMLRFTAVGYELPRTKAVELELDGEWVESKYGYQLQVEQWQEIVPQTADGLLAYLGSGLIKGIGPKTAEDIVATFGPDTLNILDNEPEKLLQIRGITEGKLKDIEESYAESRVLRNLMSLLGPFKITPATALKIYQNFGPACVDILKKCPYGIRNKQAKKRRCKRDMGIVEKMKKIPAAPSNLARWIDRNVMPHYLFYSYDRNQPATQVFCTYCEKFSVIKKPKTGKIFVCPQCKQKAIAKAQGRRAAYHEDRETCQVIQKISDEELLIRIFKARWVYKSKTNTPVKEIYENARLFIRAVGQEGTATDAYYYDSSYDSATHWRRGNRPKFSPYTSSYEADDTGAVYLPSLKRALQGTPWQYCALRQFYEPTKEIMQVSTYLRVYRRYPKLIEHLVKVGFEHIVADIVYRHGMGPEIDDTQKRTHCILRVNKEDLSMLRELNAGSDTLKACQQYTKLNLRGRQELLRWQLKNHVHTIPTQWLAYMTARKFMCYMDSQLPDYMQLKRAFLYRSPMEEAISTYSDYLQMCQGQNYDMKSSQVLFPKHCNEAHDELSRYIKKCRDEQTKRAFREVYTVRVVRVAIVRNLVGSVCRMQCQCASRTTIRCWKKSCQWKLLIIWKCICKWGISQLVKSLVFL